MGELRGLKRWLGKQKVKARRERRKRDGVEKKAIVAAEYEQLAVGL